MSLRNIPAVLILCATIGVGFVPGSWAQSAVVAPPDVFHGSSPCDVPIRTLLGIPREAAADLIEWRLELRSAENGVTRGTYELRGAYGPAVAGLPGLGRERTSVVKAGRWAAGRGTRHDPQAPTLELEGALSLVRISPDVLHVLDADRRLLPGTSGWSHTLARVGAASPGPAVPPDDEPASYQLAPLPTGPSVFGIFEGRTPGAGITRVLRNGARTAGAKLKWRVTLLQDPSTRQPTTYRVEGTFQRERPREGRWTISRDSSGVVYRLEASEGDAPLLLREGDVDVLFFLDAEGRPLAGDAHFSYTLNRRTP